MWSCGVILYILLCGYMPFNAPDPYTTELLIQMGKYTFPPEEWDSISPEAKTLVKKLLAMNPDRRLSAEEALKDPWINNNTITETLNPKVLQ